jgi:oligosaccharide repeat unit polymerase
VILFYLLIVVPLFAIFLLLAWQNRHAFVLLLLNAISITHIVGMFAVEMGADAEFEATRGLNGATAAYLVAVCVVNLLCLRAAGRFRDIQTTARPEEVQQHALPLFVLFLAIVVPLCAYTLIQVPPLLRGGSDMARVEGVEENLGLGLLGTKLAPALAGICFYAAFRSRRYILPAVLVMAAAWPLLMFHKSQMIMTFYGVLVACSLVIPLKRMGRYYLLVATGGLAVMLLIYTVHMQELDATSQELAETLLTKRLFVGQGSTFYLIWDDFVNGHLPSLGDTTALAGVFRSKALGILDATLMPDLHQTYIYQVTLHYTNDFFATYWNIVSTGFGQAVYTFGIWGLAGAVGLFAGYLNLVLWLIRRGAEKNDLRLMAVGMFAAVLATETWNMGEYASLAKLDYLAIAAILATAIHLVLVTPWAASVDS